LVEYAFDVERGRPDSVCFFIMSACHWGEFQKGVLDFWEKNALDFAKG
jgi:hypothetical protein